jgi:hypothetical protein
MLQWYATIYFFANSIPFLLHEFIAQMLIIHVYNYDGTHPYSVLGYLDGPYGPVP